MAQERLVFLCLMSANVDVLRKLDVNEVSKKFAAMNLDENQYQCISEDGEVLIVSRYSSLRRC